MFAWYALQKRTPLACFKLSFSKESRLVSSFAAFLMHPTEAVAIFIAGEASQHREGSIAPQLYSDSTFELFPDVFYSKNQESKPIKIKKSLEIDF